MQPRTTAPQTYKPSGSSFILLLILSTISIGAGCAGAAYFYFARNRDHSIPFCLLSIGFAILGAYLLQSILFSRITLSADQINYGDLFSSSSMRRDDIEGYRLLASGYGFSTYVVTAKSASVRKLRIPDYFRLDAIFFAWLPPNSNLDDLDLDRSQKEIEADPSLGNTRDERLEKLQEARRYERITTCLSGGIAAWAFLYPKPYKPLIAALSLLPLVAIWLIGRYPGLFRVDKERADAHPTIAYILLFSCISTYRAVLYVNLLHWAAALGYAVIVAIILFVVFSATDRVVIATTKSATTLFLLLWVIGLGMTLNFNALLDHSTTVTYHAVVTKKHTYKSTHHVTLIPWGPSEGGDEDVSRSVYESVEPGSTVCVYLWRGALNIPNYSVGSCQ